MPNDDKWEPARLIPVSGLSNTDEQERRGASALLAVIQVVKEYGRSITQRFGAPAGTIEAFIEVTFEHGEGRYRPDGLIRVRRGSKTWIALIEVKTGRNSLDEGQVKTYLEIAREQGFDAVITISNQVATVRGATPVTLDKRTTKKVELHHISWSQIHSEALVEEKNQSVSDPEQAWILREFIRYLEYSKSGAIDFDDMGQHWVPVRDAAANSTLRAGDKSTHDVVDHFSQLVRYVGMSLSGQLGVDVRQVLSKKDRADPVSMLNRMAEELATSGRLSGAVSVPNAASPLAINADLRAGRISCSVDFFAPLEGRPMTRVSWLLRQLKTAPPGLLICAFGPRARDIGPILRLDRVLEKPESLLPDAKFDVRYFSLTTTAVAGTKRGQGRSSFVGSVLDLTNNFYELVVQNLKPWIPPAPKVKPTSDSGTPDEPNNLESSSVDAPIESLQILHGESPESLT
jgi:hypothetical protein